MVLFHRMILCINFTLCMRCTVSVVLKSNKSHKTQNIKTHCCHATVIIALLLLGGHVSSCRPHWKVYCGVAMGSLVRTQCVARTPGT